MGVHASFFSPEATRRWIALEEPITLHEKHYLLVLYVLELYY